MLTVADIPKEHSLGVPTLDEQIAFHRSELQRLEQQQRGERRQQQREYLTTQIVLVVGKRVAFSAADLWQHQVVQPALAATFSELHICSARQLGKRLKHLGFTRIGSDWCGAIWMCE
jgi:hypothetical protein